MVEAARWRPGCARMDRLTIGPQVGNLPHIAAWVSRHGLLSLGGGGLVAFLGLERGRLLGLLSRGPGGPFWPSPGLADSGRRAVRSGGLGLLARGRRLPLPFSGAGGWRTCRFVRRRFRDLG